MRTWVGLFFEEGGRSKETEIELFCMKGRNKPIPCKPIVTMCHGGVLSHFDLQ